MSTSTAKTIRTEIKNQLNLNSKHVSVRSSSFSMGSSVDITIKTVEAYSKLDEIKRIVSNNEKIHRCSQTGEILGGGNTYTHVSVEERVKAELAAPYYEAAKAAIEAAEKDQGNGSNHAGRGIWVKVERNDLVVYISEEDGSATKDRNFWLNGDTFRHLAFIMATKGSEDLEPKEETTTEPTEDLEADELLLDLSDEDLRGLMDRLRVAKGRNGRDTEWAEKQYREALEEYKRRNQNASQAALDVLAGVDHPTPEVPTRTSSIDLAKKPGNGKRRNKQRVAAGWTTTATFSFSYC